MYTAGVRNGMNGKQYARIIGIALALAATLGIGYWMGAGGGAAVTGNPETGDYLPVAETDLDVFAAACGQEDYDEIARLGTRLFTEGRRIPDHATRFADYETVSYSPQYSNYEFLSGERNGSLIRIILTVETATGKVDEFLAEKTTIME